MCLENAVSVVFSGTPASQPPLGMHGVFGSCVDYKTPAGWGWDGGGEGVLLRAE